MSSADRDDARLPARVEALLSEWPLPEKDGANIAHRFRLSLGLDRA